MSQVISKGNARHYVWGEVCDGWHLVSSSQLSVIEEKMPPGTSEVRHYHNNARQFFFVLKGTAALELDGTRHQLRMREGLEVPAGAAHQMFNNSDEELEFLVISCPPSHGDKIRC